MEKVASSTEAGTEIVTVTVSESWRLAKGKITKKAKSNKLERLLVVETPKETHKAQTKNTNNVEALLAPESSWGGTETVIS